MKIKSVHLKSFKRFTDLKIQSLPKTAKLVVLVGPNGSGKTSVFDAFNVWRRMHRFGIPSHDKRPYYAKAGAGIHRDSDITNQIAIQFHDWTHDGFSDAREFFTIRSAYRNEADFQLEGIHRVPSVMEREGPERLIDNDIAVSLNYRHLVSSTLAGLYGGEFDHMTGVEIVDFLIGRVRGSMLRVFDDLVLTGPGDPLSDGTFLFEKGSSRDFAYKNLSGGEKAAFDLLLDLIIRTRSISNSIFCIDEPEVHLNSRVQGTLLREMVALIPDDSQLWISTHSIGMMRAARDMKSEDPNSVVFLNFFGQDFDTEVVLTPEEVTRTLWQQALDVALGDLAELVAPQRVVICEGRPASDRRSDKAELDAACYRVIFGSQHPDVAFVSVGNEWDVRNDTLQLGPAIEAIVSGTKVTRLIDRDDRNEGEIEALKHQRVRVLSCRNLESYLFSEEIVRKVAVYAGREDLQDEVVRIREAELCESVKRGNPPDDLKSPAGNIYTRLKSTLSLSGCGNTVDAFKRGYLAPLVTSDTETYQRLHADIFGD